MRSSKYTQSLTNISGEVKAGHVARMGEDGHTNFANEFIAKPEISNCILQTLFSSVVR